MAKRKVSKKVVKQIQQKEVEQTIQVVYMGTANKASVIGKVTGKKYFFNRDGYGMPQATLVDEKDFHSIVSVKGKACCGKDPEQLFQSKVEWDLELQKAKQVNR